MEHPEKILNNAVTMYSGRISVALDERTKRFKPVGLFVLMESQDTRIVPDMKVRCLEKEDLIARCNPRHPTFAGAMAKMSDETDRDAVPFGVIYPDGGVMVTTLKVFDADRHRREES